MEKERKKRKEVKTYNKYHKLDDILGEAKEVSTELLSTLGMGLFDWSWHGGI